MVGENYNFPAWAQALGLEADDRSLADLKWHELVGQGFLAWEDGQLHRMLESHERGFTDRLRALLRGEYYVPYLPCLLRGDVDVDRADFIRRDTHQCGVAYGGYDLDWLVSTCTVGEAGGKLVVGFDSRKAVRVVEQFLTARRALYDSVYHHRMVRSAEGMVALLLRRYQDVLQEAGDAAGGAREHPLVRLMKGDALGPQELLSLDDYSLWVLIDSLATAEGADDTVRDLAQRLLARDLFKLVPCASERVRNFLLDEGAHERIHDAIRPFCPKRPEYYLIVDRARFVMLAERECSYSVSEWAAAPMRDHDELHQHRGRPEDFVRLFTVREAVEAVAKVVG